MGEVPRATRARRDVALKVLPKPSVGDADTRACFDREAHRSSRPLITRQSRRSASKTNADGSPVIVMEFVEGPTLADRIGAARCRSTTRCRRAQICDGTRTSAASSIGISAGQHQGPPRRHDQDSRLGSASSPKNSRSTRPTHRRCSASEGRRPLTDSRRLRT